MTAAATVALAPSALVSTDTRRLRPGDAFLALRGEAYDGADFIAEAVARGASAIVATPAALAAAALPRGVAAVPAADPRAVLFDLARVRRSKLTGPVIGITGSVGKTTTCAFAAAALGAHATEDGRNTFEGVAATLAGAPPGPAPVVVELAMRQRGDIAGEAAIVRPTAGVITGLGPAHVGLLGGLPEIAAAKAELIAALPAGAPLVLPAGEPLLDRHRRDDLATVTHGPGGDVEALGHDGGHARVRVGPDVFPVGTTALQPHNLRNVATTVALLVALGRPVPAAIDAALPPLRWEPARLGDVELVLDCANSSPPALAAALETFAAEPAGRRLAVLGLMADLGAATARLHREAGAHASRLGLDVLIAVGEPARPYLDGFAGEGHAAPTPAEARRLLAALGRPGDRALVKGSRAAGLAGFAEA